MKISKLIEALEELRRKHGDIEAVRTDAFDFATGGSNAIFSGEFDAGRIPDPRFLVYAEGDRRFTIMT